MKLRHFSVAALSVVMVVFAFVPLAAGETMNQYIPISDTIMLQKTTITLDVPSDNPFPWGYIRGTVENPASGYPVIIQIFQHEHPVHFAQVNVLDGGEYEYRFRALDVSDGVVTRIFDGIYQVVIYKVVYNLGGDCQDISNECV